MVALFSIACACLIYFRRTWLQNQARLPTSGSGTQIQLLPDSTFERWVVLQANSPYLVRVVAWYLKLVCLVLDLLHWKNYCSKSKKDSPFDRLHLGYYSFENEQL